MEKKKSYILGGILTIFGIIFLISPQGTFESIVLAAGIILIAYSLLGIISAILSKSPYGAYSVSGSIIALIIGIILSSHTEEAVKLIPVLLGIWLLISGISKLIITTKFTKDIKVIANPITKIIIGIIALALPVIPLVATGIFIGIILIFAGVTTIINAKEDEVVYKVKIKK